MPKKISPKLSVEQLTVAKNGYIESLEVKEDFTPQTDDHVDLGSSTKEFKDAYIDGVANVDEVDADKVQINTGGSFVPQTDDNVDLGSATAEFKNIYIDGSAFVDKLENGGNPVYVGDHLIPDTDNAYDLGSDSSMFRNLYIIGGAVIAKLLTDLNANAKEIKNVKHILRKATVNPTPGVSGSYGTGVDITPTTGYYGIIPLAGTITWGGTFAAGETVTVRVTATYSDGTTASITRDRTDTEGTGTEEISITNLLDLLKDGVAITKLTVASVSDQASTSVTTSATIGGRNT